MNMNIGYPDAMHNLMLRPAMTSEADNEHVLSMYHPQYIRQLPSDTLQLEAIDKILGYAQHNRRFMSMPTQYRTSHFMSYECNEAASAPLYQVRAQAQAQAQAQARSARSYAAAAGTSSVYMSPENSHRIMLQAKMDHDNYEKRVAMLSSVSKWDKVSGGVGGSVSMSASDHSSQKTVNWEDRLKMLVEFKKAHGHCMVPQSHPHLGGWVKWQREKYALYEKGKTSNLTPEKIETLNKLGFVWRVRRKRKANGKGKKTKAQSDESLSRSFSSFEERREKRIKA